MPRIPLQIAVLVALLAAAPALAQQSPPLPAPSAPSVTLTAEQFQMLVAKTVAGPIAPAAVAPATVTTTTTTPGFISAEGIAGFSWYQIVGFLIAGALSLLGAISGGKYLAVGQRVKNVFSSAVEYAYWEAERDFKDLSGEQKFSAAMGLLYQQLQGHGIPLDPGLGAQAATMFAKMAAQQGAQAEAVAAVDPAVMAKAQADAAAARLAATPSTTASDIAAAAAKP
jgi:hypothetical protein